MAIRSASAPSLRDQIADADQVFEAEIGAPPSGLDEGIRPAKARPRGWKPDKAPVVLTNEHDLVTPGRPTFDQLELSATLRVEGVGHPQNYALRCT